MTVLHGKNLIGARPSSLGSSCFHAVNPVSGAQLEPAFYEATDAEVNDALNAAQQAFEEYRHKSANEIAAFLEQIAEEITGLGDVLVKRVQDETALPEARVLGERTRATDQLRLFASTVREGSWVNARIDRADPNRKPAPKPDVRRMLRPIGPVAVFGASNFPLAISTAGSDTASALAAGNPVIVKGHPSHPGTSELLAGAILNAAQKCGMPRGIFSLLNGTGANAGLALVRHPLTKAVAFTGSLRAGRAIFDAARSRPEPIPCFSEMGSVNPVVFLPGILREKCADLAKGFVQSLTLGVGQFCTNPGLVLGLACSEFDELIDKTTALVTQATPGTMLNSGICDSYWQGVERLRRLTAISKANKVPASNAQSRGQAAPAVFVTDEANIRLNPELLEEVFGPATLFVRCATSKSLEELARSLPGQLTMTVHGNPDDLAEFRSLFDIMALKAGRLIVNGFPTGVEVCPSMHHGGPYPATTDAAATSLGSAAILRFARPVCYQDFPEQYLPVELRNDNERQIWRMVNGEWTNTGVNGNNSGKNKVNSGW